MAYSNFSRKQAGVLYRNAKEGKLNIRPEDITIIYARADAYINHDVVADDVEAKLRNAVDAVFQGDLAKAQDQVDAAMFTYHSHWKTNEEYAKMKVESA